MRFIIFPSNVMKIIVLCYMYRGITISAKWCSLLTAYELRAVYERHISCKLAVMPRIRFALILLLVVSKRCGCAYT